MQPIYRKVRGVAGLARLSRLPILLALLAGCAAARVAVAGDSPDFAQVDTPRYVLRIDKECSSGKYPSDLTAFTRHASETLDATADEVAGLLGVRPTRKIILRFLPRAAFVNQVKAPAWTTGMFYRGEIVIPVSSAMPDDRELRRTLRHEYVHALVAELSDFRSPAWLDEGLAQLIEGEPSPTLGASFQKWLGHHQLVPLQDLQRGFTLLPDDDVAAAYGESLAAVKLLLRNSSVSSVVSYLRLLSERTEESAAFKKAFQGELAEFEAELAEDLSAKLKSGSGLF